MSPSWSRRPRRAVWRPLSRAGARGRRARRGRARAARRRTARCAAIARGGGRRRAVVAARRRAARALACAYACGRACGGRAAAAAATRASDAASDSSGRSCRRGGGGTLALGRRHRSAPSMELAASRRTGVSGCAPAVDAPAHRRHARESESRFAERLGPRGHPGALRAPALVPRAQADDREGEVHALQIFRRARARARTLDLGVPTHRRVPAAPRADKSHSPVDFSGEVQRVPVIEPARTARAARASRYYAAAVVPPPRYVVVAAASSSSSSSSSSSHSERPREELSVATAPTSTPPPAAACARGFAAGRTTTSSSSSAASSASAARSGPRKPPPHCGWPAHDVEDQLGDIHLGERRRAR